MIDAVTFKRFKRFDDQRVPLQARGVSLVAGGNNSGKSSVLHGLAVWEFCRTVIEAEKGPEAFLSGATAQGLGLGDDEFSPINVPSLRHLWTNLKSSRAAGDTDGYTLRIKAEWHNQQSQPRELEFGLALANDRLFVKTTSSTLGTGDRIPRVAYLPPFAGITDREARVPGAIRRRRVGEGLAGAVLRNLLLDLHTENGVKRAAMRDGRSKISNKDLRDLRRTDAWELLQQALRTRFGAEIAMAPFSAEYHSYIRAEVLKGNVKGYQLRRYQGFRNRDLMVEGSGFLQWLSVFALAVTPDIDTLVLDEPDAHLHCSLQQHMLLELERLADASGRQVLLATHSTEILKAAEPQRILELSTRRPPRVLTSEAQKVGLLAGLGSEYTPRLERLKKTKRLLLIEGSFDLRVLRILAAVLGREVSEKWVEWPSKNGHKDRKHFFIALKEEIPELRAVSLRDRDDEPVATVGDACTDTSHNGPSDFHSKKWRRRHIESYLIWPPALAQVAGNPVDVIETQLRDDFAIAVGDTFPDKAAPDALLELRGKDVLRALKVDPEAVARAVPADRVPVDIVDLLDELERLE